jgi:hypothetical protein
MAYNALLVKLVKNALDRAMVARNGEQTLDLSLTQNCNGVGLR